MGGGSWGAGNAIGAVVLGSRRVGRVTGEPVVVIRLEQLLCQRVVLGPPLVNLGDQCFQPLSLERVDAHLGKGWVVGLDERTSEDLR